MQLLATQSTTCVSVKIDKRPVKMFFNLQAKIKKPSAGQASQSAEYAHLSNLEQSEPKIVFKDKWPIPLETSTFAANRDNIHFGSTYPSFLLKPEPIDFDLSQCKFESMDVRDPLFVFDFAAQYLFSGSDQKYPDKRLRSLGWLLSSDGDLKSMPFGLIKVQNNPQFVKTASRLEVQQMAANLDWTAIAQCLPFSLQLFVMPPNFQEFWRLIAQKKFLKMDFSARPQQMTFGSKQEEM